MEIAGCGMVNPNVFEAVDRELGLQPPLTGPLHGADRLCLQGVGLDRLAIDPLGHQGYSALIGTMCASLPNSNNPYLFFPL